jgi:four helix bundle protein
VGYNSFEDMTVWKNAMNLGIQVFHLTEKLPKKEDFGLTSQIRRSALSVSGNIAEGFGRKHYKDKLNFYYDARGSLSETKNYLIYGKSIGYFTTSEFDKNNTLIENIWKELNSLIVALKSESESQS